MDWLYQRQARIETGLAQRHLREGSIVRCDTSSSYVEGDHMALAEFGYSREGQKNKKPINYGRLLDPAGRPVGLEVFPGNTADPATLGTQLKKLREPYGCDPGGRSRPAHPCPAAGRGGARRLYLDHGPAEGDPSPGPGVAECTVVVV